LFICIILTFVAFVPYFPLALDTIKGYIFSIGISLSLMMFIIARLYEGSFPIPRSKIIVAGFALAIVVFLSSIFSSSFTLSFWGRGFEIETAAFFLAAFFAFFLSSHYFMRKDRFVLFFSSILCVNIIVALYILFRLFAPSHLGFGVFDDAMTLPIGTWNDAMLFFAFSALISLSFLDLINVGKGVLRILSTVSLVMSMIMLIVGNFLTAWILFGALLLVFFIYVVTIERSTALEMRKIPVVSLIVLLLCVLFVAGHSNIGTLPSQYFKVSYSELRPSLNSTLTIAKESLPSNPLLGVGPNQFAVSWAAFRPQGILGTNIWNVNFTSGNSIFFTSLVTMGILGFLAWLLFIASIFYTATRKIFVKSDDITIRHLRVIAGMLTMYLLLAVIVFTPGLVIQVLLWVSAGILVAQTLSATDNKFWTFSFMNSPKKNFVSMLVVVLVLLGSIVFAFVRTEQFLGRVTLVHASQSFSREEPRGKVESLLSRSTNFAKRDDTYTSMSLFYTALLKQELNMFEKNDSLPDDEKTLIKNLWTNAESYALLAVNSEPKRVENWLFLSKFYFDSTAMGITGSLSNTEKALKGALVLSPSDPAILVSLAVIAYQSSDITAGNDYVVQALTLDPTFKDAITLQNQIKTIQSSASSTTTENLEDEVTSASE